MSDAAQDRTVLAITGTDRRKFLQDLVTNDVSNLTGRLVYAALLTPQGKYLFDFFLLERGETILLDVQADRAAALMARLMMYRLRADVQITDSELLVSRGIGEAPENALPDPRHDSLGWRYYDATALEDATVDWTALRVAACVPKTGAELIADSSYILECGFERLHGVDFVKGCYVGQEVTARMKHKTELRKGLALVSLGGEVTPDAPIEIDGRTIGTITSVSGNAAIAYLRFDRAGDGMTAGGVPVDWVRE